MSLKIEPANHIQILCVDNDQGILSMLYHLLSKEGYKVYTASSGRECLKFLKTGKAQLDMIFLDLDMPGLSGHDVCREIHENKEWALIPVIYLTASKNQEDRLKAFKLGAVGYLNKPITQDVLLNSVIHFADVHQRWLESFKNRFSKPSKNRIVTSFEFKEFKNYLEKKVSKQLPSGLAAQDLEKLTDHLNITPDSLALLISEYSNYPLLTNLAPEQIQLGILPTPFCKTHHVIPFQTSRDKELAFLIANPFNMELQDVLKRFKRAPIYITPAYVLDTLFEGKKPISSTKAKPSPIPKDSIKTEPKSLIPIFDELQDQYQKKLAHQYKTELTPAPTPVTFREHEAPIIRFVNRIIENAYHMRASDIHIEPREDQVAIRYRIDGNLREIGHFEPPNLILPIIARIKIMSNLDITEKRLPQDGRISFKNYGEQPLDVDLRISTAPMNFGEKAVIRLLDKSRSVMPLENLGFSEKNLQTYRHYIRYPYGMILHVGPTGSGKSLSLYAALNQINREEVNIQTIEDPIEYTLPTINQLQIQPDIGLTFSRALKSYLRQDPDILMVGEIRDRETAHTAIEASLTGHLLFSTLHTNDAASTLSRFLEMGIEPFMISSSILLICAQRLLRRLCPSCKIQDQANKEEKELFQIPDNKNMIVFRAKGCTKCDQMGYMGRIAVHEILVPNQYIRHFIGKKGVTSDLLKKLAVKKAQMTTLFWDSTHKVYQGVTSPQEVFSKIRMDEFNSCPIWWRKLVNEIN